MLSVKSLTFVRSTILTFFIDFGYSKYEFNGCTYVSTPLSNSLKELLFYYDFFIFKNNVISLINMGFWGFGVLGLGFRV
jgi:hypothetical protein